MKQLAQRRREETGLTWADAEPDFTRWESPDLPERVKEELADVIAVGAEQLELVEAQECASQDIVLHARYRDRENGREYTAELGRSDVLFRRVGADPPQLPEQTRQEKRRLWRRRSQ